MYPEISLPAFVEGFRLQVSALSLLGFGLLLGLKHAVEADHVAAVSTIVSERRSLLSASLVGGWWGLGHTISLLAAGVGVIWLRLHITAETARALELAVASMLVWLGAVALRKLLAGGRLHFHFHRHGRRWHAHPHLHDAPLGNKDSGPMAAHVTGGHAAGGHATEGAQTEETHHGLRLGARPLAIGMLHGLAGSAALMLLILSNISSPLLSFVYIAAFGLGSIGGMMLMSALVGLPAHLSTRYGRPAGQFVRGAAGLFSLGIGLFMMYEICLT